MAGELMFKHWFRDELSKHGVFTEAIEPAHGSGLGVPDLVVQFPEGRALFVELKVGNLAQKGGGVILQVTPVRPTQYVWGRRWQEKGGLSCIVVGLLEKGNWSAVILRNLNQEDFMKLNKNKAVGFGDFTSWKFWDCTLADFEVLRHWLSK